MNNIRPSNASISLVFPCYNEEEVLPELFRRVTDAADKWGLNWTVICINDGSSDRTWELLKQQNEKDPRWKAISFSRNFGHQTAVSAGIFYADGDAVAILDADLQDPPEELHAFIEKWQEGYDAVYAIRTLRKEGPFKKFCYWAFYRILAKIVSIDIPLDSGDFCLMDRKVVDALKAMPERVRFVRGLRAWAGFKQIGVPYKRAARAAGSPKYTFQKLIKLAADGVFNFSGVPLKLISHFGLWVSVTAFLGAVFTLLQRIFSDFFSNIGLEPVPGFATIVISILFLGGIQLICLGIVGEYLVRIFEEVKQRPQWLIQDSLGINNK